MHFLKTNFNSGELTPLLLGRPDIPAYSAGCVQLENFIVRPYGGVFKAPGTQWCGEVKTSAKRHRLVPFQASDTEQFFIELGNLTMRFWRASARGPEYLRFHESDAPDINSASYNTTIKYALGSVYYDTATSTLKMRTARPYPPYDTGYTASDWTTVTDATPYEWVTPWAEADLPDLQWQQINRVLVFVHPDHPPYALELPGIDAVIGGAIWKSNTHLVVDPGIDTRWEFAPIKWSFPPLRESPYIGEGRTVTLDVNLTAWANATNYVIGNLRKQDGIAYYCTANHLSATATNKPGSGTNWTSFWRTATSKEYDMTLTASNTDPFTDVVVGDDFVIEPPMSGRSVSLLLSSNTTFGPSSAVFIQGAFVVRTEWASGASIVGTLTLEESLDNSRWEIVRQWEKPTIQAGTLAFEGEAPSEGAWYRIKAVVTSGGAVNKAMFLEPTSALAKIALRVRSLTSSTVLVVDSGLPYGGTVPGEAMGVAATSFYMGAFSEQNGYPSAVSFHNLRLWFGGTAQEPNRLRSSAVNDFFNFATGAEDDDGFDLVLASNESNLIKWIASFKQGLVVGTAGEEWTIQGSDSTEILKPSNVQAVRRNRAGSKSLMPVQTKDALLWASANGRRIFEFAYVFTQDDYESPDMTLRAEHITQGGIQEMAFQTAPDPILWCVTGNGILIGFSYNRENEITAWFKRTTDGVFESVATTRSSDGADQVWLIVKRTINGATKRYIERFYPTAQQYDFDTNSDLFYVDCGAKKPVNTTGLGNDQGVAHLEGEQVVSWEQGTTIGAYTVSGGAISLNVNTTAVVGLPMTSTVQAMPLEVPTEDGTSQGRFFRPNRIVFLMSNAMGGTFADNPDSAGMAITYPAGTTTPFTGRVKEHLQADWVDTCDITIKHSDPTPFNLLGYVLIADVSGQ
jgi:hypothetical protein